MATIIIPTPLRKFTNGQAKIEVNAPDVRNSLLGLVSNYPEIGKHLLDPSGSIRGFVNIFVGEEDIRNLQKTETPVSNETVISIVPAIAGGSSGNIY